MQKLIKTKMSLVFFFCLIFLSFSSHVKAAPFRLNGVLMPVRPFTPIGIQGKLKGKLKSSVSEEIVLKLTNEQNLFTFTGKIKSYSDKLTIRSIKSILSYLIRARRVDPNAAGFIGAFRSIVNPAGQIIITSTGQLNTTSDIPPGSYELLITSQNTELRGTVELTIDSGVNTAI